MNPMQLMPEAPLTSASSKDRKADDPQITFICCVESGWLEDQTLRLIESLRKWGGRLANAPVIAVTPRFGPSLTRLTHQTMERFGVRYVREAAKGPYPWFNFLNKPRALIAGEALAATDTVCWLDSDIIITGEPDQLVLKPNEDFAACASDQEMGTTGPENPFHPIWEQHCQKLGLTIEDLPWITTEVDQSRIRLYWNGGLIVYRRATEFARHYMDTCLQLLNLKVGSAAPGYSIALKEMSAIGFAMVKQKLRWRALPDSHNSPICSSGHKERYSEANLKAARLVHYHDSMWPPFWPEFMRCMRAAKPEVADWLESRGPMKNGAPFTCRAMTKILNYFRGKQASAYKRSCKVI